MHVSEHLYMGEKAKKHRFAILQGLRKEKFQPEVYVITLPENGKNVLDIYPAVMLQAPGIREKELRILGIAVTYWEALELVRQMVEERYQKSGDFYFDNH